MTDWCKNILRENILHSCRQFNRYALLDPIERNSYLIDTLREMLIEAEKYQTEITIFEKDDDM